MTPSFNYLYQLQGPSFCIVEVRKTGLPEAAPHDLIYKWLLIDLSTLQVSPLDFKSTDSSGRVEERFFEQGYLKFDEAGGTFIEKFNLGQHALQCISSRELPNGVDESVAFFLGYKRLGITA